MRKRVVLCGLVLDVGLQRLEPVDVGGQRRCDGRAARVAGPRQFRRRAGGVGRDHRPEAEFGDDLAALAERVHVARHALDRVELRAWHRQQLVAHPQEVLADDVQVRIGHQMVDVGDPSRHRVLDRDHGIGDVARRHRGEGLLEGRRGDRLAVGIDLEAGDMGVGARLALVGDPDLVRRHEERSFGCVRRVWEVIGCGRPRSRPGPARGRREYRHRRGQCQRGQPRWSCRRRGRASVRGGGIFPARSAAAARSAPVRPA
jgi:hypothetical protein